MVLRSFALDLIIFVAIFGVYWTCNRCIKHLQKQATPTGVVMADDEFIIHVEGTPSSQRIVRHIGGTSWPGTLSVILIVMKRGILKIV